MAAQQGTYAVFFGLPVINELKVGTTSTPAAITAEVQSVTANATAESEETRNTEGEIVHVSTFNQRKTVEIEGFFRSDTATPTTAEAISAQDLLVVGSHVVLVGAAAATKNFDDVAPYAAGAGQAYRLEAFTWTANTSGKATFRATLTTYPSISSLTWLA